jgi:hypothetical protein
MAEPLPPLGLDDLRVAEPDRDSAAEFMPEETWVQACHWQDGAIARGYAPAAVAAILMELPGDELDELRDWWAGECDSVAQEGQGRDALCHDLLLCRALDALHPDGWPLPMIDPATVLDLLDERAAVPADAVATVALWAAAFFDQSGDDDDVSDEEQEERDAGIDALGAVQDWLGRVQR